jgi:hypothetical protein
MRYLLEIEDCKISGNFEYKTLLNIFEDVILSLNVRLVKLEEPISR